MRSLRARHVGIQSITHEPDVLRRKPEAGRSGREQKYIGLSDGLLR
jgi:hypothetical protein